MLDRFSGLKIVGVVSWSVEGGSHPSSMLYQAVQYCGSDHPRRLERQDGQEAVIHNTRYHSIGWLEPSYLISASWKGSSSRNEAGTFHIRDREFTFRARAAYTTSITVLAQISDTQRANMNVHGREGVGYNEDQEKRWKDGKNPEITNSKTW